MRDFSGPVPIVTPQEVGLALDAAIDRALDAPFDPLQPDKGVVRSYLDPLQLSPQDLRSLVLSACLAFEAEMRKRRSFWPA